MLSVCGAGDGDCLKWGGVQAFVPKKAESEAECIQFKCKLNFGYL